MEIIRLLPKTVVAMCFSVAVYGLGLAAETAHAQTFVNGGFEADSWAPGWNTSVSITGWDTVPSGDGLWPQGVRNTADTTNSYTPFGIQFAGLCAAVDCPTFARGSLSQTVSGFVVGAQYRLNFQQAPEHHVGTIGEDSLVNVSITGGTPASTDFSGNPVGGYFAQWKSQSLVFTANATVLTFTFSGVGTDSELNSESGIDQVSVTALGPSEAVPTMPVYGLVLIMAGLLVLATLRLRVSAKRI